MTRPTDSEVDAWYDGYEAASQLDANRTLTDRVVDLEAKNRALLEAGNALAEHADHAMGCPMNYQHQNRCICGTSSALAVWRALQDKQEEN